MTKKKVNEMYKEWRKFNKEATGADVDVAKEANSFIVDAYRDLKVNWSNEHAELFVMAVETLLNKNKTQD